MRADRVSRERSHDVTFVGKYLICVVLLATDLWSVTQLTVDSSYRQPISLLISVQAGLNLEKDVLREKSAVFCDSHANVSWSSLTAANLYIYSLNATHGLTRC